MSARLYASIFDDEKKAVELYKQACSSGSVDSCMYLGNILKNKNDYDGATKYYNICLKYGEQKCANLLSSINARVKHENNNGIQSTILSFDSCSGSEYGTSIDGKDLVKIKEESFMYAIEDKKFSGICDKLKVGQKYKVTYRKRYLDDLNPGMGEYNELIGIKKATEKDIDDLKVIHMNEIIKNLEDMMS